MRLGFAATLLMSVLLIADVVVVAVAVGESKPKPHKLKPVPVACVADGVGCNGPIEMLPKPETKPSNITALMEAIAPTPKWACTTEVTETRITTVCEKAK